MNAHCSVVETVGVAGDDSQSIKILSSRSSLPRACESSSDHHLSGSQIQRTNKNQCFLTICYKA